MTGRSVAVAAVAVAWAAGTTATTDAVAARPATTLAEAEAAIAQLVTVRRDDGRTIARGSAFFIDEYGRLLTCAHVLDHVPREEVARLRLRDGVQRRFTVVAVDREADLALLQSDRPDRFFGLDEAAVPTVGQAVLLGGFPARESAPSSAAAGAADQAPRFRTAAVVALERRWAAGPRRTVGSRRRLVAIKVDAIADPGQSGGPLLAADTLAVLGVLRANLERATGGLGGAPTEGYAAAVPLMYVRPLVSPPDD